MTQRLQQRAVDASAVSAEAGVGTVAAVPATDLPGHTQTPAGGVSVASSDGVTASPGPAQSAGTVLSEPAATAAAGAPAHTRASPASPGSSASSHDPIRDMDFDNVPALSSSCSWSDLDQELDERALNIAPEVDRPNISKGRPRIPHLRKVLTERG